MTLPASVLIVDGSNNARGELADTMQSAGYNASTVQTFEQAAALISRNPPAVLITELRLGAFNGLHLVIRSHSIAPRPVVIVYTAFPDPVLETEARRLGADFLSRPVSPSVLLDLVERRLGDRADDRRTSPRKQVPVELEVMVAHASASLVDLSYGGFCVALHRDEIPSPFEMHVPGFDFSIQGKLVWANRRTAKPGTLFCGASVTENSDDVAPAWRNIVDNV